MKPGEVLLLEHRIPGVDYDTGLYVLLTVTEWRATVALVSQDARGLYAIDNPWTLWREDRAAFTPTAERARLPKS